MRPKSIFTHLLQDCCAKRQASKPITTDWQQQHTQSLIKQVTNALMSAGTNTTGNRTADNIAFICHVKRSSRPKQQIANKTMNKQAVNGYFC